MEIGKGTGEVTHGGRVEISWEHCTRVSEAREVTFRDGAMTIVTANGDEIAFTYRIGTLSIVNEGILIDTPFIITGGTGRFESASGAGSMHGEAPGATPGDLLRGTPFDLTIDGAITYAPGGGGQ